MKRVLVAGIAIGVAGILIVAGRSEADPDLTNVPPHRHFVATPTGMVEVGPRVCDNPNLQKAFNQFHNNIHVATASGIGRAAPGLHNFKGAEVTFTAC